MIGNPGLSLSQQQSQFCLWAIFAAPLLISADLRTIPSESRAILLNNEIIAVNQDPLGRQGWCAEVKPLWRVWVRELEPSTSPLGPLPAVADPPLGSSNRWAIVLENRQSIFNAHNMTFDPRRHLPTDAAGVWNRFSVRDLIQQQDRGVYSDAVSMLVDESSVVMLLVMRLDYWKGETMELKQH